MIVGAGLGSMVADMYGRRRLLFTSLAAMLTLHCLVAVSISWLMFVVLRALAVGFAGATLVVSFVLVIEFLGPDWRDACTCSCLWVLGAILMSVQTLITVHWRWLALLSGGICLPLVGAFFTSTESVRWLQCQQRFPEAENGLREVVSVNAATVTNIMQLLDHSRACIVNNMHYKRYTFLDLFHSLASTRWTLALIYTG
ncbi:solute carrier family 22 member 7 [Plakobranchus ocellatus]|uniref:Solute carrier family 22 member 7 n=1 Tax=Plakobranchus ocellatus TaxID=259542 RepID=A0AAV4DL77_9GAST|nr:solute carrier family 22 member 7 [Plakobranchus ocellatus]